MIGRHCSTNFLTSSTKDGLTSSISVKYRGMDDIRWDERTPHFQIESLKVFFFSIREMYFLKQTIIIILRTIMRKQSVLYACDMKNYRKPISLSVKAKSSQFSLLKFDNVLESLKQSNEARRTKKDSRVTSSYRSPVLVAILFASVLRKREASVTTFTDETNGVKVTCSISITRRLYCRFLILVRHENCFLFLWNSCPFLDSSVFFGLYLQSYLCFVIPSFNFSPVWPTYSPLCFFHLTA